MTQQFFVKIGGEIEIVESDGVGETEQFYIGSNGVAVVVHEDGSSQGVTGGHTGPANLLTGATGPTGADSTVPGPTGPQGPQGPTGADSTVPGPTGPRGPTATTIVLTDVDGILPASPDGTIVFDRGEFYMRKGGVWYTALSGAYSAPTSLSFTQSGMLHAPVDIGFTLGTARHGSWDGAPITWSISDTEHFNIDSSGVVTAKVELTANTYPLSVTATNLAGSTTLSGQEIAVAAFDGTVVFSENYFLIATLSNDPVASLAGYSYWPITFYDGSGNSVMPTTHFYQSPTLPMNFGQSYDFTPDVVTGLFYGHLPDTLGSGLIYYIKGTPIP